MLKKSSSTTSSQKERKNIRLSTLRKINFSVPTISESRVEEEIFNQQNSLTSLDSVSRYARTTVILEVAENHRSYSECDTSENNYSSTHFEETTSGYCTAETPESATRIFSKLSLKKEHRMPTKCQSDSIIGKRKSCCCCKLPLCPIDNCADADKENAFCQSLCTEKSPMSPSTRSSTTFRMNSSDDDAAQNRHTEVRPNKFEQYLMSKPCAGSYEHPRMNRDQCCESDSEEEECRSLYPMTLIHIEVLEELCERLLEQMCTSTGYCAPKKAKSAQHLVCKGKALKYPKSQPKHCFMHKSNGALVPNFCLKRRTHDTVDLYQYYRCQWQKFYHRIPTIDMDPRNAERWQIREKFRELWHVSL